MYGTIGRVKVKPGKMNELIELFKSDTRQIDGAVALYAYQLDNNSDELMLAAVFRDKKSYFANADDPAQDAQYRKMVALLEAEPTWNDGEIIYNMTT